MVRFLVISMIFAAIAGGIFIPLMQALAERILRQYITSSFPMPEKGNQPLNRFSYNALHHPFRLLWPIFGVVSLPLFILLGFSLQSWGDLLTGLPSMLLYLFILGAFRKGKILDSLNSIYRQHAGLIADSAIRRLMYHPSKEDAAPMIQIALNSKSKHVRERAKKVFALPLKEGTKAEVLALIPEPDAEFLFTNNNLQRTKTDLESLSRYLQIGDLEAKKVEIGWNTIEAQLYLANRLLPHYPHVFCQECLCRAEKLCQLDFAWLQCPACQSNAHLITDVKTVIGEVGKAFDMRHEGELLYLGLWDDTEKKARWAEVESIQLCKTAIPENLDWALSALAE